MLRKYPSLFLLLCLLLAGCTASASSPSAQPSSPATAPTVAQAAGNACKVSPLLPAPDPVITGALPPVTETDHIRGNPAAKYTIIEYSDFQ
jgi:protein-disulfide isomerase